MNATVLALLGAASVCIDIVFVCSMKIGDLQFVVCTAILAASLLVVVSQPQPQQQQQHEQKHKHKQNLYMWGWGRVKICIAALLRSGYPDGLEDLAMAFIDMACTVLLGPSGGERGSGVGGSPLP